MKIDTQLEISPLAWALLSLLKFRLDTDLDEGDYSHDGTEVKVWTWGWYDDSYSGIAIAVQPFLLERAVVYVFGEETGDMLFVGGKVLKKFNHTEKVSVVNKFVNSRSYVASLYRDDEIHKAAKDISDNILDFLESYHTRRCLECAGLR